MSTHIQVDELLRPLTDPYPQPNASTWEKSVGVFNGHEGLHKDRHLREFVQKLE